MSKRYLTGKLRRKKRARAKILAKKTYPRLSVFRSNKYIYAQIINDQRGETCAAASDKELDLNRKPATQKNFPKMERARLVGELLAKKALAKGIKSVIFDRGLYRFHGRVKALAEGAKEGGLKF